MNILFASITMLLVASAPGGMVHSRMTMSNSKMSKSSRCGMMMMGSHGEMMMGSYVPADTVDHEQHRIRSRRNLMVSSMMMMMMSGDDDEMMCMDMGMYDRFLSRRKANKKARTLEAPPLPETYSYNPSLSNVDWAEFTLEDFSEALQCKDIPSDARPIHGASTWRQLRQTYEDVVGPRRSSIRQTKSDLEANKNGQIETPAAQDANNLYAGNVPEKGRGMIASRDIKEGENIWSDVYMAAFYDSRDLNLFLAVLPSELACDVILWTYEQDDNPDDFYFSVDLDLSTFCNDGGSSGNNIKWQYDATANTAIAARDINAGEEILCDYGGDYEYENGYQYDEEDDYE